MNDYYNLVFVAAAEISQGLIVFMLVSLVFAWLNRMLFSER